MFFTGAPLSSVCEGDVLASEADDTGKYIATLVQRGSVVFLTLSSPDAVTLGETVVAEGLDSISPASAGSSGSSTSLSSAKIIWSSNAGTLVAWRSVENKLRAWDVEMLGSIDFRLPMPAWINAPPVNSAYALNTMQLNHVFCPAFPSGDAQAVCKAPGVGLLIATSDGGVVLTSWHGAPIRSYRYNPVSPVSGVPLGWVRDMAALPELGVLAIHFNCGALAVGPLLDLHKAPSSALERSHSPPTQTSALKRPSSLRWAPGRSLLPLLSSQTSSSLPRTSSFLSSSSASSLPSPAGRGGRGTPIPLSLLSLPSNLSPTALSCSHRSAMLAVGTSVGTVLVYQFDCRMLSSKDGLAPHITIRERSPLALARNEAAREDVGAVVSVHWAPDSDSNALAVTYGSGAFMLWSLTGTRLSPLLARTGPITMCWAKQGYTLCVASPQPHSEGESGDDGTITRLECFDVLSVCSSSAHRGAPLLSSACVWAHTHDRVLSLRPSTGRNCVCAIGKVPTPVYDLGTGDAVQSDCDMLEYRWSGLDCHPDFVVAHCPIRSIAPVDAAQVSVAGQTGLSVFLGKSEKWRCGPTVKGVPWTVIDMAWWKGQYVVALVRLVPEDPTSPTNYCLRVHPCGNLDPSAVLASVQLPTGVTPTRVCVGSTNAVHSVGTARVGNWVAVAAESADGTVELGTHVTVSPTASTASSDGGDKAPPFPVPSPSHASVETGSTHVKLWPAESTALSAGTPVVIVFKLRLVAKEESPATPSEAPTPRRVNIAVAALSPQTSVFLPFAARFPLAVCLLSHSSTPVEQSHSSGRNEHPPDLLLLTRDGNLVCISLADGSQSLIAQHVSAFWYVDDSLYGCNTGTEAVFIQRERSICVWIPPFDPEADVCANTPPDPVLVLDNESFGLGVHPTLGSFMTARPRCRPAGDSGAHEWFDIAVEARPCLHVLLRVALLAGEISYAESLCRRARLAGTGLFQRELQHLLHGALEEAAVAKGSAPSVAHLKDVITLLSPFPERLQVIAKTGRQTELSRAKLLFSVAGSCVSHFNDAVGAGDLPAALWFLLLVQDEALAVADENDVLNNSAEQSSGVELSSSRGPSEEQLRALEVAISCAGTLARAAAATPAYAEIAEQAEGFRVKLSAVVTAERAALAAARPRSRVSVSSRVPNPMATEDQLDQDFGLMAPAASPPLPEPIVSPSKSVASSSSQRSATHERLAKLAISPSRRAMEGEISTKKFPGGLRVVPRA